MNIEVILVIIVTIILVIINLINRKITDKKNDNLSKLLVNYKNKRIFLCKADEELGGNLIQLYGIPTTKISPGMKISDHRGLLFPISEVYADDKTPEKSDPTIDQQSGDSAIVLKTKYWDHKGFQKMLKKEKAIPLEIKT